MLLRLFCSMLLLLCLHTGVALARPGAVTLPSFARGDNPPAVAPLRQEVSILGAAEATEEQMAAFIRTRNPQPRINCSIEEIVATYFREGAAEGVRGDIALCQALKETGFFRYGGTVKPQQNNFCGLGTTSATVGGASFTTVERGVRAHIQHLLAYASTERPRQQVIDPRYDLVRKVHPDYAGMITAWTGLNGTWAVPGKGYGQSIVQMWQQAKNDTEVNRRLLQDYTRRIAKGDAEASLKRGKLYAQQGLTDKAMADYKAAENFGPLKAESMLQQGLLYEAKGDMAQAVKSYERALAADRRSETALVCLNNVRKRTVVPRAPYLGEGGNDVERNKFMQEAVKEADSNLKSNEGGPFGAVVVKDGKIIARAHNRVLKLSDPTAHAEVEALRAAAKKLGTHDLSGCELYTSCQPCPMCLGAIIWSNIKKVYYGNTAEDVAAIGFRDDYIYKFIEGKCNDGSVLELEPLGRDKTIGTFQAFANKNYKTIY